MNQRQIGTIVIILGILFSIFLFMAKAREDRYMETFMNQNEGSCINEQGTCLHKESFNSYLFGATIALSSVILGSYLMFFDKTQKILLKQQKELSYALKEAKENERKKDEFKAFLSGFKEDEKKVLEAVKEQDGIQQSTLRYRTGMSKTALSLMLNELEERSIISRQEDGKTKKIFLQKRF